MGEILGRLPRGSNGMFVLVWEGLKDGREDVRQLAHLLDALPCRSCWRSAGRFDSNRWGRGFRRGAWTGRPVLGSAYLVRIGLDRHESRKLVTSPTNGPSLLCSLPHWAGDRSACQTDPPPSAEVSKAVR